MSKQQKRIIYVLSAVLILVCVVTGVKVSQGFQTATAESTQQPSTSGTRPVETTVESTTESLEEPLTEPLLGLTEKKTATEPVEGEFVLRSVGDLLMHETVSAMGDMDNDFYKQTMQSLKDQGYDVATRNKQTSVENQTSYDFTPMFAQIAPFTEYADATIANLETIATYPDLPISGYPQFNGPSALLNNVKDIGIDIVSNGTNHSLDYFTKGALLSVKHLKEAGLMYAGSFESFEDQKKPRIIEKNGIKVGFLTYTYGTNGIPVEEGKEFTINMIDVDKMSQVVKELKKQADAVVVSVHDGEEYETLPNDDQRYVFEILSQAGADLIIGGHPHVLQPVDWYNNGKTFAIYSQASFISGQVNADSKQGGIMQVTFKRQEDGTVKVIDPKFMPTYIKGVEGQEMYQVVPYADYDRYAIPDGQAWWQTIEARMKTYTEDFDFVSHLETKRTQEDQDTHR